MNDQQKQNRPGIPVWVWIIGVLAIILGMQLWLSGRFEGPEQVSLPEAMNMILDGSVDKVTVTGDRIQLTLASGREVATTLDPGGSLDGTLKYFGVTQDVLSENGVTLIVVDRSTWNNLFNLAMIIGPLLLLIWFFSRGFRQTQGGGGNNIFGFGRSRAKNLNDAERPTVTSMT